MTLYATERSLLTSKVYRRMNEEVPPPTVALRRASTLSFGQRPLFPGMRWHSRWSSPALHHERRQEQGLDQ
jgi:hypothetical protein